LAHRTFVKSWDLGDVKLASHGDLAPSPRRHEDGNAEDLWGSKSSEQFGLSPGEDGSGTQRIAYILIIYINYIFIYNSDFDWKICSEVFQGFSKNVLLRFLEVFHQFLDELNWNSRQVMELWRWRIANARAIFTNRL